MLQLTKRKSKWEIKWFWTDETWAKVCSVAQTLSHCTKKSPSTHQEWLGCSSSWAAAQKSNPRAIFFLKEKCHKKAFYLFVEPNKLNTRWTLTFLKAWPLSEVHGNTKTGENAKDWAQSHEVARVTIQLSWVELNKNPEIWVTEY